MTEVGTFEAKNRLSELLDKAERGEETVITRRGRPVAKLIPLSAESDMEKARDAAKAIRKLAKEMNLGPYDWEEWKRYRDEGRNK
jgi:prevent-host-death family protein